MINSMNPKNAGPNGEKAGEALKKIQQEYGMPEEKSRDPVKKMGKDDFFRIMITQIKNQDPTSPYKNEEMASQMAQFTSLEQMFNVNQNLEKLADSQQPLHQLGAAGLIGKYVTSDSSHFVHNEGKYSDLNFELPVDAAKVKIAVLNQRGEVIREIEKPSFKKGANKIEWDGKRSNNMQAPTGVYGIQVTAETEQGKSITVTTNHKYQVHGIGFEGKETVLLVGDLKSPQKILLKSVAQIEDASLPSAGAAVAARPSADAANAGDASERAVPGADLGQASRYSPIDVDTIRAVSEKQTAVPQPSYDQVRAAMDSAHNDLTEANPAGKAIAEGKQPAPSEANNPMNGANPAALQFAGKLPRGDENSIAGNLLGKE